MTTETFSAANLAADPAGTTEPATTTEATQAAEQQPAIVDDQGQPVKTDAPALAMPGKDATPEEWGKFYDQIGRPESADKYELPVPEGDDGSFAKEIAPVLHKHGLTAAQAKGLAEDWNAMQKSAQADYDKQMEAHAQAQNVKNRAEESELKTEWGTAFEANMHHARIAVKQFFPQGKAADVIGAIESKIGYKETVKFMHALGKGMGESDLVGAGGSSSGPSKTVADVMYPTTAKN